ncbi:MAG: EAL domain-containing protein, partial [Marinobacterium sp.]
KAMQHFVRWYQQGLNPGVLSVNLNVRHFQSQSLKRTLDTLMAETGFQPHWLEVEVTETQLMTKPEEAIQVLTQLNRAGIRIALDDFGTGYSSLSYLKRLPITKLKIDQSFVRDLPDDAEDASIVRAVIALAESLGLEILAEGAETEAQINFLAANRCDRVQGYYYARPMPAEDAQRYLTPDRIRAHS